MNIQKYAVRGIIGGAAGLFLGFLAILVGGLASAAGFVIPTVGAFATEVLFAATIFILVLVTAVFWDEVSDAFSTKK